MRTDISRLTILAMTLTAGLVMGTTPAFALSVPAYSGSAGHNSTPLSCLQETDGGVKNNCGSQVYFDIPLTVNSGAHTVGVSTYNPGGGTFSCQLIGFGASVIETFGTPVSPPTGFSNFNLSVTVPDGPEPYLLVECNFNPGGVIYDVVGYTE